MQWKIAGTGFEPATPRVWTACSSQLSYPAINIDKNKWDLQDLNLWPSACKADALPAELRSHVINEIYYTIPLENCQHFFYFFKNVTHDILLLHILTILPDDCQMENQPHHWTNNVYLFNTFISFLFTHPIWDVTDTEVKTLCTLTISTHTSRVGCDVIFWYNQIVIL